MIPLFNTHISDESKRLAKEVLDSTFLNQGPFVDRLEEELAYYGFSNPITLNSCTNSLFLALKLAGVQPGDEVILPTQTFIATGLAVLMVDAIPVFCDIDINGNARADDIASKITNKTKAVIVVHWGGLPANMDNIANVCKDKNIKIIEDAAHAFGAEINNKPVGSCEFSDFTCFSLQCIKAVTCGDGGILCCKTQEDADKARKLRWFGIDKKNVQRTENGDRIITVTELGYKMHMNDLCAAIALGNFHSLPNRIRDSRMYARIYLEELSSHPYLPVLRDFVNPSWWLFTLRSFHRNEVIQKLKEKGIQASTVDTRIDIQPVFAKYHSIQQMKSLIGTALFNCTQFSIPCHADLTPANVVYIARTLKELL